MALAADGWELALVGRSPGPLAATRDRLSSTGARAITVAADVRRTDEIARAVADAELRLGALDVLVNCAGVAAVTGARGHGKRLG